MDFLKQFFILLLFVLLGYLGSFIVPIPGLILGLFFLFLALVTNRVQVENISVAATGLISLSGLFFVPLLVNILSYIDILKPVVWRFLLAIFGSTVVSIGLTAWSIQVVINWQQKKEHKVLQALNHD